MITKFKILETEINQILKFSNQINFNPHEITFEFNNN